MVGAVILTTISSTVVQLTMEHFCIHRTQHLSPLSQLCDVVPRLGYNFKYLVFIDNSRSDNEGSQG